MHRSQRKLRLVHSAATQSVDCRPVAPQPRRINIVIQAIALMLLISVHWPQVFYSPVMATAASANVIVKQMPPPFSANYLPAQYVNRAKSAVPEEPVATF
jgi:hypothetical protein